MAGRRGCAGKTGEIMLNRGGIGRVGIRQRLGPIRLIVVIDERF